MRKVLLLLLCLFLGVWGLYDEVSKQIDHAKLRGEGQRISGNLRRITHHRINLIPSGESFDVEYAGRTRTFKVNEQLLRQHTLNGGAKFTYHEIPVV